jgi:hypothetical protein
MMDVGGAPGIVEGWLRKAADAKRLAAPAQ